MLRLVTFGGLGIIANGTDSDVRSARNRLVCLAVIAVAGDRGIRRERLASLCWPDSDEERARTALRQALFVIRKEASNAELVVGTTELRLNREVIESDVTEFLRALAEGRHVDAVQYYRGPFLEGVNARESDELERWIEERRLSLALDYARALERLAQDSAGRAAHDDAVRWWELAAAHDRLSSRVARSYMEALVASGRREDAIAYAAQHAAVVRATLDAEPDAGILEFAEELRSRNGNGTNGHATASNARASNRGESVEPPSAAVQAEPPPSDARILNPPLRVSDATTRASTRVAGSRFAAVAVIMLIAALGVLAMLTAPQRERTASRGLRAVAVMPLINRTGDSTLNGMASLAASRIRSHLTTALSVHVLDAERLTGDASEALVRGTMERKRDSLLVIIELVHARDGRVLLSDGRVFPSQVADDTIFRALTQVVSGAVAALNDTTYLPWTTASSRLPRYDALREFQAFIVGVNSHDPSALTHVERAMQLDPDFVEAKLWFIAAGAGRRPWRVIDSVMDAARAQRDRLGSYDQVALDHAIAQGSFRNEEAYQHARRLVALAPRTPDAYLTLIASAIRTGRYREVNEAFHRFRSLGGWTQDFAGMQQFDLQAHRFLGEFEDARAELTEARARLPGHKAICVEGIRLLGNMGEEAALDSLVAACRSEGAAQSQNGMEESLVAGRQLRRGGFHAAAERAFKRALLLEQRSPQKEPNSTVAIAVLHCEMGNWTEANRLLRGVEPQLVGHWQTIYAVAAAHVGDSVTARAALRTLDRLATEDEVKGFPAMERAFVTLALGRRDEALKLLQESIDGGIAPAFTGWFSRWELAPLNGDPRFERMIGQR